MVNWYFRRRADSKYIPWFLGCWQLILCTWLWLCQYTSCELLRYILKGNNGSFRSAEVEEHLSKKDDDKTTEILTYVDTDSPVCSDPCNETHVWFIWIFEPGAATQTSKRGCDLIASCYHRAIYDQLDLVYHLPRVLTCVFYSKLLC